MRNCSESRLWTFLRTDAKYGKFSSETQRIGGRDGGRINPIQTDVGSPWKGIFGQLWEHGLGQGASKLAPRAACLLNPRTNPPYLQQSKKHACGFMIAYLEVLSEKLFFPHWNIFRWESDPKGQMVLEIEVGVVLGKFESTCQKNRLTCPFKDGATEHYLIHLPWHLWWCIFNHLIFGGREISLKQSCIFLRNLLSSFW